MAKTKMAELYAQKVHEGKWRIKDVPLRWRKEAQALVKKMEEDASE